MQESEPGLEFVSETEVTVDHVEDEEAVEVTEDIHLGEGVFSQPHSRHNSGNSSSGHNSRHNSGHSSHSGSRRRKSYRKSEDVSLLDKTSDL